MIGSDPAHIVAVAGQRILVGPPLWGDWAAALDRAGQNGEPDPVTLVAECLLTCLWSEGGAPLSRAALAALSPADREELLTAALAALERQRADLVLQLDESSEGATVTGTGISLRLRPWSFGERNAALRHSLAVVGGRVRLDLGAYEQAMVLGCTVSGEGARLAPADLAAWPVALGEMVTVVLNRLNGLAPGYLETLQSCLVEGRQHPDLTLLYLCQAFGWTPEQAERLDAATVERLLATLRLLPGRPAPGSGGEAVSEGAEEGVTRIIVHDA